MSVIMLPGSTGSELNLKEYSRKIEPALYNEMQFLPTLSERAEKIKGGLYVRRLSAVASQTLSSTNDGTTFNFSDFDPRQYEVTPTWLVAAGAYPTSGPRRQGPEIEGAFMDGLKDALAAGIDVVALAEIVAWAGTPIGNNAYNIEAAGLRTALTNLETASKRRVKSGRSKIHTLLYTSQIDDMLAIPEINNAYQRGDGKAPTVTGRQATGYGQNFDFSTLIIEDGNGRHGAAYHEECIHYGYNQRPTPDRQKYLFQVRLLIETEVGAETIYQELMQSIRHAA